MIRKPSFFLNEVCYSCGLFALHGIRGWLKMLQKDFHSIFNQSTNVLASSHVVGSQITLKSCQKNFTSYCHNVCEKS